MSTEASSTICCPFCDQDAPRLAFGFFARPPGREHEYAELLRCPRCRKFFGPLPGLRALDSSANMSISE